MAFEKNHLCKCSLTAVWLSGLQTAHWEARRSCCREPGEYLLMEDTTELDYTARPVAAAACWCIPPGQCGWSNGRKAQWPEGVALGLFYQQSWVRGAKRRRETWRQRIKRPRQSQCWTAAGSQWIFMADREADFYEPIEHGQPGWHTIWRGWQRLMWMCRGLESLQSTTI